MEAARTSDAPALEMDIEPCLSSVDEEEGVELEVEIDRGDASRAIESSSFDKDSSTFRSLSRPRSESFSHDPDASSCLPSDDVACKSVPANDVGICERKLLVIANAYLDPGASRSRLRTISTCRWTCASTLLTPWCKSNRMVSRARARRRCSLWEN